MCPTLNRELELVAQGHAIIIGVDEAGRGPLAGPVVAAAVEFAVDFQSEHLEVLDDSKKLSAETRDLLFTDLTAGLPYGVGIVDEKVIDDINIRQASWLAMQHAVADLVRRRNDAGHREYAVSFVLIDGLPYGPGPWPYEAIVKGDTHCYSIAAASIIAKVTRDRLMVEYDALYPQYGFASHKGYCCPQHFKTLREHGPCPLHRKTFAPVRTLIEQAQLDLFAATTMLPEAEENGLAEAIPVSPIETKVTSRGSRSRNARSA